MQTLVALAAVVGYTLTMLLAFRMFRGRERAFERKEQLWASERKELLDRLMYMADRPWEAPPPPPVEPASPPPLEVLYPEHLLEEMS